MEEHDYVLMLDGYDHLRQQYAEAGFKQQIENGIETWYGQMNLICKKPRSNMVIQELG